MDSYRTYASRQGTMFHRVIVAETPTRATVMDNTVMDGAMVFYRTYAVIGNVEQLLGEASATQPARFWDAQQLVISQPGTYTLNHKNTDRNRPAVVAASGVLNVNVTGRMASTGNGINVGDGAGVSLNGLGAWGLHPGVADQGHGYLFNGYLAASMIMENCFTQNWRFSVYALGNGTSNLQTLRVRYNRMRNCEGRKTLAGAGTSPQATTVRSPSRTSFNSTSARR